MCFLIKSCLSISVIVIFRYLHMTPSNENIFRITGPLIYNFRETHLLKTPKNESCYFFRNKNKLLSTYTFELINPWSYFNRFICCNLTTSEGNYESTFWKPFQLTWPKQIIHEWKYLIYMDFNISFSVIHWCENSRYHILNFSYINVIKLHYIWRSMMNAKTYVKLCIFQNTQFRPGSQLCCRIYFCGIFLS